ncbi:LysR substrate-binding domain-containing protein [Azorhizophilus paspali]|uniref:LysR substrate-binding domain-containing protein n=1 Tax=Azorhizophilus paspali TaxID=69963 RepID=A0ABV6SKP1_AZOPA
MRYVGRLGLHVAHANLIILPRIQELHRRYPQIELVISSKDRLVDLLGKGIDRVVRAGQPRDFSMVARRLVLMPEVVCASPDYLDRHGRPRHPEELAGHQAVGFFPSNHDTLPIQLPDRRRDDGVRGGQLDLAQRRGVLQHLRIERLRLDPGATLAGGGASARRQARRSTDGMAQSRLAGLGTLSLSPAIVATVFVEWLSALYAERFGQDQAPRLIRRRQGTSPP